MNKIQIDQFSDRLEKLGEFGSRKDNNYEESEIIDWISECINIFYEIGVDAVIIRHFLDYFSFGSTEVEIRDHAMYSFDDSKNFEKVKTIGPFREIMEDVGFMGRRRIGSGRYRLFGSFYYAKVAFSSARSALKRKTEEKSIVPSWLIEQAKKVDKISHLASSLELIENKYRDGDAEGLIAESTTLLGSVLNLDADLREKVKIGSQLNSLVEDKVKLGLFGVSDDLVRGLNSGRIIRNGKVSHKAGPLKYEIPFMIATSFAYLVLFFVECAVLNGKIISNNK